MRHAEEFASLCLPAGQWEHPFQPARLNVPPGHVEHALDGNEPA